MSSKVSTSLLKSSSFRHTLLTAFAIWLTTSIVLILVYFNLENAIWAGINDQLDQQSEFILELAASDSEQDTAKLVDVLNASSASDILVSERMSPEMMAMHNTPAMQAMHQAMGLANPPEHLMGEHQSVASNNGHLILLRDIQLPNGETLTLTHNVEYLNNIQTSLWHSLIFGLSITLLIAILSAVMLTQRSLRRMHQINAACQTIMAGNLSYRIPYKNGEKKHDDYDQMAKTINQMLDEINELVNKVQQVSDNIAHDLKSPLARLRTRLESLSRDVAAADLIEGIDEVDRLLTMINSLLGISRLEGRSRLDFSAVNLSILLNDVVEMYQPVFEEKDIELTLSTQNIEISGDKNLLFQAIANLLDNALKFTPEKGSVRVSVDAHDDESIQIEIRDSGPGVTDAEKVFDRFYREDSARDSNGFGLGLSLVKAIVKLHSGCIDLENEDGLVVRIRLPLGEPVSN